LTPQILLRATPPDFHPTVRPDDGDLCSFDRRATWRSRPSVLLLIRGSHGGPTSCDRRESRPGRPSADVRLPRAEKGSLRDRLGLAPAVYVVSDRDLTGSNGGAYRTFTCPLLLTRLY